MKRNVRKKLGDTKGITLIALVITIIVLLILAGVSLSMVLNQDGIFRRAEQATDKYGQAKARETLELVLSEFQMTKYEEGLSGQDYENRLDSKIAEVGALLPKEDENSNYQLVIVEGHIFEIDRSVPKIVDYKGPANGVIVTAKITQNGDWQNPVATVSGTITKYGGGSVTSSSATATNNVTIPSDFPTTGGSYTISNITTDTVITITTTDSEGTTKTHIIPVNLVRDNTPPVISDTTATAKTIFEENNIKGKITISARATDSESGLASLEYEITGYGVRKGTLTSGTAIEVEVGEGMDYTVKFTAIDNAGNQATVTLEQVHVSEGISIADLKEKIDESNYLDYLGMLVDYNPIRGGRWRVFYYDATGAEFGDGARTIYLKSECQDVMSLENYNAFVLEDGGAMMRRLNPLWASSTNGKKDPSDWLVSEHCASWLSEPSQWTQFYDAEVARYAIGAAPIEMWCKAQNAFKNKYDTSASTIECGIENEYGYGYKSDSEGLSARLDTTVVSDDPSGCYYAIVGSDFQWLASPSSGFRTSVCTVKRNMATSTAFTGRHFISPVVCLRN